MERTPIHNAATTGANQPSCVPGANQSTEIHAAETSNSNVHSAQTAPSQQPQPPTDPGQTPDKASTNPGLSGDCPRTNSRTPPNFGTNAPDIDLLLRDIEEEIAASYEPLSPLDKLSPEQQELLFDLLSRYSLRRVRAAIANPPPKGMDIQIGLGALSNFIKRYKKRDQLQKKRDLAIVAHQVLNEPAVADDGYVTASERLLKIRLLEVANNPSARTADIRDLFQTLIRLRAQTVAEKKLKLTEQKLKS